MGFSADDKIVYLRAEQPQGPDVIVSVDLGTRERKIVLSDDNVSPAYVDNYEALPTNIIYRNGTRIPVGAFFMDGKPRTAFIDEKAPEAKLVPQPGIGLCRQHGRDHVADVRRQSGAGARLQ